METDAMVLFAKLLVCVWWFAKVAVVLLLTLTSIAVLESLRVIDCHMKALRGDHDQFRRLFDDLLGPVDQDANEELLADPKRGIEDRRN